MTKASKIPQTMKAAQASAFGDAAKVLAVSESVPTPSYPPAKSHVLIKVHACSLSPSDYRMLSGSADLVKKPSAWPYTAGGDVAGVVVAVHDDDTQFAVGDHVMGTWDVFGTGGVAEYTAVHTKYVARIPQSMRGTPGEFERSAAMVDSGVNALLASDDTKLKPGDKVLVLGGSGGVGTTLIQIAKKVIGVDTVIATSTDEHLVQHTLGADHCIDYTKENWWESDIVNKLKPFDAVIDCAEGANAWNQCLQHGIVKPKKQGGRFLAVVLNDWHIEVHSAWDLISFFVQPVKRSFSSCWNSKTTPSYKIMFPAPRGDSMQRFLDIMEDGKLDIVIDKNGPHEFTTEGVVQAFDIMVNRKGHGKVVIKICDDNEDDDDYEDEE